MNKNRLINGLKAVLLYIIIYTSMVSYNGMGGIPYQDLLHKLVMVFSGIATTSYLIIKVVVEYVRN